MFVRPFCILSLGLSALFAEPLQVSPELFRTPEFKQRFVGSYGFLPEVEPKVTKNTRSIAAKPAALAAEAIYPDTGEGEP